MYGKDLFSWPTYNAPRFSWETIEPLLKEPDLDQLNADKNKIVEILMCTFTTFLDKFISRHQKKEINNARTL